MIFPYLPARLIARTFYIEGLYFRTGTEFWNYLAVQFWNGGTYLGGNTIQSAGTPSNQWNKHSFQMSVPTGTTRIHIAVYMQIWSGYSGATGDIWWDDILFGFHSP